MVYLFSGFLRCADCGKAMVRNKSKNFVYYYCRTYREKSGERCAKHAIRGDVLERAVLVTVQRQVELVDSLVELVEEINAASASSGQCARWAALEKQKKTELEQAHDLLDGLYLDLKAGDLSREQYRRMKGKLEAQAERLQGELSRIREERDERDRNPAGADPYLDTFLRYHNIQSLSRGLLVELVRFIYIHEDGSIDIEFNYADQFRRLAALAEDSERAVS